MPAKYNHKFSVVDVSMLLKIVYTRFNSINLMLLLLTLSVRRYFTVTVNTGTMQPPANTAH